MKIVFFLEEESAKAMLDEMLPRILPNNMSFQTIAFEGKQHLEGQLLGKLRNWLEPNVRFFVLRDKDHEDCEAAKARLKNICNEANKPDTIVRIVCTELESWYLGDLLAVEEALEMNNIAKHQKKIKFRNPDNLANAKQELKRITNKKYQQISGSRLIGKKLNISENANKSYSFNVFLKSINEFVNI